LSQNTCVIPDTAHKPVIKPDPGASLGNKKIYEDIEKTDEGYET
jgi:hypothetical protein